MSEQTRAHRVLVGKVIVYLLERGWTPPTHVPAAGVDRFIEDVAHVSGGRGNAPTVDLAARELEVLQEMANGADYATAGRRLHVSAETIKTTLSSVRSKLGVQNTTHAVAVAVSRGLVRVDDR